MLLVLEPLYMVMAYLELQMYICSQHQIQNLLQALVIRHLSLLHAEQILDDLGFLNTQQGLLFRCLLAVRPFQLQHFLV